MSRSRQSQSLAADGLPRRKDGSEAMKKVGGNEENRGNTARWNPEQPHSSPNTVRKRNWNMYINKLDNFLRMMYCGVCSWTIVCGSCPSWLKKVKNQEFSKITKFSKHSRSLQARLPDLTNVAAEFYEIALWQNWQTASWNNLSLLEPPRRNRLSERTTPIAKQAWTTNLWSMGPDDFHGQVWYHGQTSATPSTHIFSCHPAIQIMR